MLGRGCVDRLSEEGHQEVPSTKCLRFLIATTSEGILLE